MGKDIFFEGNQRKIELGVFEMHKFNHVNYMKQVQSSSFEQLWCNLGPVWFASPRFEAQEMDQKISAEKVQFEVDTAYGRA